MFPVCIGVDRLTAAAIEKIQLRKQRHRDDNRPCSFGE